MKPTVRAIPAIYRVGNPTSMQTELNHYSWIENYDICMFQLGGRVAGVTGGDQGDGQDMVARAKAGTNLQRRSEAYFSGGGARFIILRIVIHIIRIPESQVPVG